MAFEVRAVDVGEGSLAEQGTALFYEAYSADADVAWSTMRVTTDTSSITGPSLHLAAFDGGELVGFNGFIAHDLHRRGEVVSAYQSCWTATAARYRGRGVFNALIEEAKSVLRARGAAFLMGFPNANSGPIMRTRLGFRDHGGFFRANVPRAPFARALLLRRWGEREHWETGGAYGQNDAQLLAIKRRRWGAGLLTAAGDGNVVWGRVIARRRAGVPLRLLSVGGAVVNAPHRFGEAIGRALRASGAHACQFLFHRSSPFARLFARYDVAPETEHLCVFDLNGATDLATEFNFFPGIKDVY